MTEGGSAAKLFTRDEASRIAVDIAKLPGLLLGFKSHGRERQPPLFRQSGLL
jgi:hypothetical protein